MKENRCSLCGGRLINDRCVLCGLDNSKSDRKYRLNQSGCDRMPLTHVHMQQEAEITEKKSEDSRREIRKQEAKKAEQPAGKTDEWLQAAERSRAAAALRRKQMSQKEKGSSKQGQLLAIVAAFAIVFGTFLVMNKDEIKDTYGQQDMSEYDVQVPVTEDSFVWGIEDEEVKEILDEDGLTGEGIFEGMYDFVPYDLPETGVHYEIEIGTDTSQESFCQITVGQDSPLPEGTYKVEWVSGEGYLILDDNESLINFNQFFTGDDMSVTGTVILEDLRLYDGASVLLQSEDEGFVLRFTAENTAPKA